MKNPAWFTLWTRWADMSLGAPEVIARRVHMVSRDPWCAKSIVESQRMVAEKAAAATEAWWAMWRGAMVVGAPMALWPGRGRSPANVTAHAIATANRMIKPASTAVRRNVKRLRKPSR